MPKRCREAPPVATSYEPRGTKIKLDDLEIYETGNPESKRLLIGVYDIYGFHPNTFHVADKLAKEGGFRIAIPDFFKGNPFSLDKYPSLDYFNDLFNFLFTTANWDLSARETTAQVLRHYRNQGFTRIAMYGTCWGGKIAFLTGTEMNDDVYAIASIHVFNLTLEDAQTVGVPAYTVTAHDDPDAQTLFEILRQRFREKVGYTRMEDVFHGFFASRANFSDPVNAKRIQNVITLLVSFFDKNMNAPN